MWFNWEFKWTAKKISWNFRSLQPVSEHSIPCFLLFSISISLLQWFTEHQNIVLKSMSARVGKKGFSHRFLSKKSPLQSRTTKRTFKIVIWGEKSFHLISIWMNSVHRICHGSRSKFVCFISIVHSTFSCLLISFQILSFSIWDLQLECWVAKRPSPRLEIG